MISRLEIKKRIGRLKKAVNHHRYLYHVLNKQEISDAALDSLKHELYKLEQQYPEFITSDSPTQRVAGKPLKELKKIHHKKRMLSLEDVFDEKEFEEWTERVRKFLGVQKLSDFFAETKFDGLAISLIYRNGILESASTRGDGVIGEDVTQNIRTIEAIPLRLEGGDLPKEIEIRGEALITKSVFDSINKEQKKKGLNPYANPRNLVAGSIRQLDSKITASRKIDFHAYVLITDLGQKRHSEEHEILNNLGFKSDPGAKICKNIKEIIDFKKEVERKRQSLKYEIDGIVITLNDNELLQRAGVVGKTPRGSVAFKFGAIESTTIVEDIRVQVGRTGVLTPVAILKPVKIGGVTVSRATLHNEDEIKRLGLKIGDTVVVGRAGDVIPDVKKVLTELRNGKERKFNMPNNCPICESKVYKDEGGVILRCVNKKCPSRQKRNLQYFVSKSAFDIEGLGPQNINLLLDQGLIQDPADIFELEEGDLIPLERFGEKSAQNLIKSIKLRRSVVLPRFLIGLGILHIGEQTSRDIAEHFGSLEKIKKAKFEELEKIGNIGPKVARSIYEWFNDKNNLDFLEKLLHHIKIEKYHPQEGKLKGKKFVFTGTLSKLSREEAKRRAQELGGKTSESISKDINFVVIGENPGSKLEKAKKLGIKIINEEDFLKMI